MFLLYRDADKAGLYLLFCLTSPLIKFCILSFLPFVWQHTYHSSVWHCFVPICLQYPIHSNQGSNLIYFSMCCWLKGSIRERDCSTWPHLCKMESVAQNGVNSVILKPNYIDIFLWISGISDRCSCLLRRVSHTVDHRRSWDNWFSLKVYL